MEYQGRGDSGEGGGLQGVRRTLPPPKMIPTFKNLVKMFCCWSKETLGVNTLTFEEIHRLSLALKFGQNCFWSKVLKNKYD